MTDDPASASALTNELAETRQRVMELRAERDALRRTLSRMYIDPSAFAESQGWDCFHVDKGHKADLATEQTSHRPDRIAVERSDITS